MVEKCFVRFLICCRVTSQMVLGIMWQQDLSKRSYTDIVYTLVGRLESRIGIKQRVAVESRVGRRKDNQEDPEAGHSNSIMS